MYFTVISLLMKIGTATKILYSETSNNIIVRQNNRFDVFTTNVDLYKAVKHDSDFEILTERSHFYKKFDTDNIVSELEDDENGDEKKTGYVGFIHLLSASNFYTRYDIRCSFEDEDKFCEGMSKIKKILSGDIFISCVKLSDAIVSDDGCSIHLKNDITDDVKELFFGVLVTRTQIKLLIFRDYIFYSQKSKELSGEKLISEPANKLEQTNYQRIKLSLKENKFLDIPEDEQSDSIFALATCEKSQGFILNFSPKNSECIAEGFVGE